MRQLLNVLLLVGLGGCVAAEPASPDVQRMHDALELVDRGVALLREEALEEAAASFHLSLQLVPLPQSLDGLGCVAFRLGELEEARRYFEAAYRLDEGYETALGHLAMVAEAQGDQLTAHRLYRAALEAEPRDVRARNNLAVLLARAANDPVAARQHLVQAQQLAPLPTIERNLEILEEGNR